MLWLEGSGGHRAKLGHIKNKRQKNTYLLVLGLMWCDRVSSTLRAGLVVGVIAGVLRVMVAVDNAGAGGGRHCHRH